VIANRPVWLVLPTYDEAANLEAIVAAAREHLPAERRLLIVDDNSPDGTGEIADRLAAEHEDIAVLHRDRKQGLGPAYVAGFHAALAGGAGLIAQMDADFSHDPGDLPRLLAATERADLVLGSSYVVSRGGSAYARVMLGVGLRDLTGGFKVFRREVLERIGLEAIPSLGYAFQVETTYRAIRAGFRVIEVPIVFRDRRVGESKMNGSIVAEAAFRIPLMRLARRP
jgi:dolichol-phosphate mannosyltransferase